MNLKYLWLIILFILSIGQTQAIITVTNTSTDYWVDNGDYNISVSKVYGNICNIFFNTSNDIINGCGNGFGGIEYRNTTSDLYARNIYSNVGDVIFEVTSNSSNYVEIHTSQRQRFSDGTYSNLSSNGTYKFSSSLPYIYVKFESFFDKDNVNSSHYNTIFITKDDWMDKVWYNDYLNNLIDSSDMAQTHTYTVGVDSNLSWMFAENNTYSDGFGIIRLTSDLPYENAYLQPNWGGGDEFKYDSGIMNAISGLILGGHNYTKEYIIYPTDNYTNINTLAINLKQSATQLNLSSFSPHAVPDATFGNNIGNLYSGSLFVSSTDQYFLIQPSIYMSTLPYIGINGTLFNEGGVASSLSYFNNGTYSQIIKRYNPTHNFTINMTYEAFNNSPYIRVVANFTAQNDTNYVDNLRIRIVDSDDFRDIDRIRFNGIVYNLSASAGVIFAQSSTPPNPKYFYWYNVSYPDQGVYIVTPNLNANEQFQVNNGAAADDVRIWALYNASKQNITAGQSFVAEYWILPSSYNITNTINLSLYSDFLKYYNYSIYQNLLYDLGISSLTPQELYKTSTCQSTLQWGTVGSALIIIFILLGAGGLAIGLLTGMIKIDTFPIIEFALTLIAVVVIGSIGVAIIDPIITLVGCP